jgi:hypothetical protein
MPAGGIVFSMSTQESEGDVHGERSSVRASPSSFFLRAAREARGLQSDQEVLRPIRLCPERGGKTPKSRNDPPPASSHQSLQVRPRCWVSVNARESRSQTAQLLVDSTSGSRFRDFTRDADLASRTPSTRGGSGGATRRCGRGSRRGRSWRRGCEYHSRRDGPRGRGGEGRGHSPAGGCPSRTESPVRRAVGKGGRAEPHDQHQRQWRPIGRRAGGWSPLRRITASSGLDNV